MIIDENCFEIDNQTSLAKIFIIRKVWRKLQHHVNVLTDTYKRKKQFTLNWGMKPIEVFPLGPAISFAFKYQLQKKQLLEMCNVKCWREG